MNGVIILDQIITLFILILFSLFIYFKILNLSNVSIIKIICGIVISGLLSCIIFILREPMPYVRFVIMIIVLGVFAGITTGVKFDLALTGIIISFGINYGLFLVFTFISAFLMYPFYPSSQSADNILTTFLSAIMQAIFIMLLFRIKRFKKGILFLQKRGAGALGLVISGIVLLVFTLIGNNDISDETMIWVLLSAVLCITGLILWWRGGLTRLYRKSIKERDLQEYEEMLAEKENEIQKLNESNELMAKLIHRDNKLLPSMYEAIKLFSDHYEKTADVKLQTESKRIMEIIDQLMNERTGIITQSQRGSKILSATKDVLIDGVINHMMRKASEKGIQFDITVVGDVAELTEKVIPAIKLETLIADLIENAIIATSGSDCKKILVTIGINEGAYELNVQDSGIPFEISTLMDLGQKKASTHLDEGGSGIGYMTVFEILHEFKFSIIITEYEPKQCGFTKSVRVRFDNKDEYIIHTFRAGELPALQAETSSAPIISSYV